MAVKEHAALLFADSRQRLGEFQGVAAFVFLRVGGAGDLVARVGKSRLDRDHPVGVDHRAVAAVLAHQRRHRHRRLELALVAVEMQDSLAALVVMEAFLGAHAGGSGRGFASPA